MRLLLGTHIALWALAGSLGKATARRIAEADAVYVSAASLWEVAIKHALGKIKLALADLPMSLTASGFRQLPVTRQHSIELRNLPLLHKDPFDRLLVAQAMSEPLHLLTSDPSLAAYSPLVIVVH
jgi:PIN domain nuclease of toxin-antitoxin system